MLTASGLRAVLLRARSLYRSEIGTEAVLGLIRTSALPPRDGLRSDWCARLF